MQGKNLRKLLNKTQNVLLKLSTEIQTRKLVYSTFDKFKQISLTLSKF